MCLLEAERLLLRPMRAEDLDDLFALRSDPQVLPFVGQEKPWTREETAEKLRRVARRWDDHGFGMWAMLDRADGRVRYLLLLRGIRPVG
jgi:RimJ/RimL family protein N-acetyltransferase